MSTRPTFIPVSTMQELPGWKAAMNGLRELHAAAGVDAERRALEHATVYENDRASMVFDVVMSRQRNYAKRVLPLVAGFRSSPAARSLRELADRGPGEGWGLRAGEAQTMRDAARGLLSFGEERGLKEEEACRAWAAWADFGIAYELDPYVGQVKGIGLALFHYMRMRAGADTLKPDLRVRDSLLDLGFPVGSGRPETLYTVVTAIAAELETSLLLVDQLLWLRSPENPRGRPSG